jgi:putative salt-induced outer membrane protein YdiY
MPKCLYLLFLAAGLVVPALRADQIFLKNGDKLTGTIISSDGVDLVIQSELAGTVTIPLEAIVQIASDQPLYITLKDGQKLLGTVAASAERVEVRSEETGDLSFARSSVAAIRSRESQVAYDAEVERLLNPGLLDLWSGSADAGLSLSRGNAETATFSLGVNAARATARDKIGVYANSLYATSSTTGDSVTTANAIRGGIRYDANLNERVFAFGLSDLEFDEFQMLDLRMVIGGGLGWHARKTELLTLDFFTGGTLNKEYFSTDLNRTSGEIIGGQELSYKLSDRISVRERLVFFPNLSETGEFRLTLDASAVADINTWLGWHVTISDRYLSNPVPGTKSNDVLLSTGIRLNFGR